jgi:DNA-binding transcriptional MocR family regulator
LRTRSIPTDGNGLDPSALEQALDEETPRFLYTIPVHQNPSGVTLSEERRGRLVELAEQHDFLILADEVYQLLTFDGAAPAPFGRFAKGAHVCALGSFSKILAPGLRMGWIHADGELIRRIVLSGFLDSGGGLAPFSSALLQTAVADGSLLEHVAVLRDAYRRRRDALLEILGGREAEARGLRVSEPAGGYFLWAELPPGRDAGSLAEAAQTAGASFVPGPRFSSTKALSRFLRISFSYYPPEQLAEGARRLLSVL